MNKKYFSTTHGSRPKNILSSWFFVFLFSFSLLCSGIWFARSVDTATPPSIITYQGKLLENGASVTTSKAFSFTVYDADSGGTALYTASGTLPTISTISITPTQGIFSVDLGGDVTNGIDPSLFSDNNDLYLEVIVDGTTLTPRKRLTASPYAINSAYLNGVQATSTPQSEVYIPLSEVDGSFVFGTTTFNNSITVSSTATSTFLGSINLPTGNCFSVNNVCLTSGGGSSQWSDSGSDIYFSSGNVGIGTSTPASTLTVSGTLHILDTATFAGEVSLESTLDVSGDSTFASGTIRSYYEDFGFGNIGSLIDVGGGLQGEFGVVRLMSSRIGGLGGSLFIYAPSTTLPTIAPTYTPPAITLAVLADGTPTLMLGGQGASEPGDILIMGGSTSKVKFSGDSSGSWIMDDFLIGVSSAVESITNTSFLMSGDDFYVHGDSGLRGNVYSDGILDIAGTGTSTFGNTIQIIPDWDGLALLQAGSVASGISGSLALVGDNPSFSLFADDEYGEAIISYEVSGTGSAFGSMGGGGYVGALSVENEIGGPSVYLSGTSSLASYFTYSLGVGTSTSTVMLTVQGVDTDTVATFINDTATCDVQPGGTEFSCSSDRNLKTNISIMGSAIDSVMQLNPVTYNWNTDPNGERNYGFIAQEVEALFPRLVGTGANGYKTLSQIGLIPFLTKAIQEQQTQIEALSVSQGVSGSLDWNGGDLDLGGFALLNAVSIAGANGQWSIDEFGRLVSNVETANGETKSLYGLQSEDGDYVISGSGQLESGQVTILFEQGDKSLIDSSAEMRVSITLTGEANGVYVTDKSMDGFVVRELQGGSSSATFDWIVIAKRLVEGQVVEANDSVPQSEGGEPSAVEDTGEEVPNESNEEIVEDPIEEVIVETSDEEVETVPEEVIVPDETPTVTDIVVPEEAPPVQDPPTEEVVTE